MLDCRATPRRLLDPAIAAALDRLSAREIVATAT